MINSLTSRLKKGASILAISTIALSASHANAQVGQQTGVADPGRIDRSLTERRLFPQASPNVSIGQVSTIEAPEGAENINFTFGGLEIEGASAYSEDELYSLYQNRIGQEISLAELYGIANQMTLKYRNDGYVLTQVVVPPQTIEAGIARLLVVEGFIDNVVIQGGDEGNAALKVIQDYAAQINSGGALNIEQLERQLLLINDLPGVSARSVISPSQTTTGAADLLVILDRNPYDAQVGVDNNGSRFLGPVQFSGAASINSALGFNEAITGQLVLAPDAGMELAFGSLSYEQPVGRYGTKLSVTGSITHTDPGFTLSPFEVEGQSHSLSLKARHPFVRSRNTNLWGDVSFDFRNVDSKNNLQATSKDRIRALRAGIQAEFLDSLLGVAVNSLELQVSQGLQILGSSEKDDANLTRAAGNPQFTKANIRFQRIQRVTNNVNLLIEGRGQIASGPLLSSEEFGLGGISTVRGFEPSEVVGDDGINGKLEVQWNTPNPSIQLFGFLDSGTVWNEDATTSPNKRASATSTGAGVRADLPMDVAAEAFVAQPMNRRVSTRGDREPRFFFSLNKQF